MSSPFIHICIGSYTINPPLISLLLELLVIKIYLLKMHYYNITKTANLYIFMYIQCYLNLLPYHVIVLPTIPLFSVALSWYCYPLLT